jgi:predicted protein tyrosine phosphatase
MQYRVIQGMVTRILFVCWANQDRSPTAEQLLREKKGFEARSAGTWKYARNPMTSELIDWADRIIVMEQEQQEAILDIRPEAAEKIIVLNIPDTYSRNSPQLVRVLKAKLSEHLQIEW